MSEDLEKELSRLQLLWSRYKNKSRMCPLEIKKEETKAYLIYEYIKDLKRQLEEEKNIRDKAIEELNKRIRNLDTDDICSRYARLELKDLLQILQNKK